MFLQIPPNYIGNTTRRLVAQWQFSIHPAVHSTAIAYRLVGADRGQERLDLAETAGDATPDGMQCLLNAATWDADGVRDDLRGYRGATLKWGWPAVAKTRSRLEWTSDASRVISAPSS